MKFKLLLILLFCSSTAFAQIQKEKGVLTLKNGEVLSGTITYYYDNLKDLSFYDEHGEKQVFKTNEIKEIKLIAGEKYVAKSYTTNEDTFTLILQVLIESSKISLYTREDNAEQYFYVEKEGVLHRLENNEVLLEQEERDYLKKDNKFIATLGSLMADRIDLVESLQKIKLNQNDLANTIENYNSGDITFYWEPKNKRIKEPNWVLFTQYSKYGSIQGVLTTEYSAGQMIGLQYYFSKSSRHSVKVSLEHSNYNTQLEKFKSTGLGFRYEYSFVKTEKYGLYLMVQLFDIMDITYGEEMGSNYKDEMLILPRLSPGFGVEAKPFPRVALYAEINHIALLKQVPKSFSLGIKYDFGKTSW